MRLVGPTDAFTDRMVSAGLDAVLRALLRTWLHTLLAIFLMWACLSTPAALAFSALVLLVHEIGTKAQIAAHNRSGREEIMRARDTYAVMVERHLADPSDDSAAEAFRIVDASLGPEIANAPPVIGGSALRAVTLNGALLLAAGASGFLLRPETARLVVWLDALSPR